MVVLWNAVAERISKNSKTLRSLFLICFGLAVFLLSAVPPEAEIPEECFALNAVIQGKCRPFPVKYRESGHTADALVIELQGELVRDGDVLDSKNDFFLKLPNGEVVELGHFLPLRNHLLSHAAELHIVNSLGIDPSKAGGLCCIDFKFFQSRAIEKKNDRYCVVYDMSHPFHGSFQDCDGVSVPSGEIGYAENVVSWKEAREMACEKFKRETNRPCKDSYHSQLSTRIVFQSNKRVEYITAFRRFVRHEPDKVTIVLKPIKTTSIGVKYDYLVYRIDALNGHIELLETTESFPDYKKWMN